MPLCDLTKQDEATKSGIEAIREDSNVDVKDCYQCGKCSAGCPMATVADMTPREIIRNLQLGLLDPVLESSMPWYCVECGVCLVRCPQQVDLPALNEAICRLAMRKKKVAVREGERFMNIFLDNVQRKGVSDEAMLAGRFNLETGHFMQDVLSAPKMMQRGLLSLTEKGHEPEGSDEVKRIVKRCREAEKNRARDEKAADRKKLSEQRAAKRAERLEQRAGERAQVDQSAAEGEPMGSEGEGE